MVLVGVALIVLLQLWNWSPSIPLSMGGDNSFYLLIIANLTRGSSIYVNNRVGAPIGQVLYDFPAIGDLLNYGYLRFLAITIRNPALTESIFYFSTYFFTALASSATLRRLRIRRAISVCASLLFAFLPYHLIKNVQHLMLGNYVALPLIIFAILEISFPNELKSKTQRTLILITLAVIAGGTGIYYAIFSLILVALATLVFMARAGSRKSIFKRLVVYFFSVVITILISGIPTFIYGSKNGFKNVQRSFVEVEYYGLKIANLLRPIEGHRLPWFNSFTKTFNSTLIPGEPVEMLGTIGTICFLLLLAFVLTSIARQNYQTPTANKHELLQLSIPTTVTITALIFSVVGGFNSILYVIGLNQIRVWARITPLLAFCAFAFGASLLQRTMLERPKIGLRATGVMLSLISIFGLLDQSSKNYVPAYSNNKKTWIKEEDFTRAADRIFPKDSMIFQLPIATFPEHGPLLNMEDYAQAFPAVHKSQLRWSYGNIKTRASVFHETAGSLSGEELLKFLTAQKFVGIHIVKRGMADGGKSFVEQSIRMGAKLVLTSSNDEDVLLDIRGFSAPQ